MPKINNIAQSSRQQLVTMTAKTQQRPTAPPQPTTPEDTIKVSPDAPKDATTPSQVIQPVTNEVKASEAKPLPPQYESLAKKEVEIRALERNVKAKEAALDTKIKEAVDQALAQFKGKLKESPLDVLNEEGLTYDQLVEQQLNQPDPAIRALTKDIQSVKQQQEQLAKQAKDAADSQRTSAIKQIEFNVKRLVENDAQYETVKATDSIKDVVDKIVQHFDETGELLTPEIAAKQIEDELFEEVMKYSQLSKVKAKLAPSLSEAVEKQVPAEKLTATTLTNSMSATKPMSARERAIAAFKGEKF